MLNLIVVHSVSKSNRAVLTHLLSYVIKKLFCPTSQDNSVIHLDCGEN